MNETVQRARQLNSEYNVRLRECLLERSRIARELHDTLFQGFISASMQLHAALEHIPEDSVTRPLISRVLRVMRQAIDDGRTTIQDLRSGRCKVPSLEQAFADLQYDLSMQFARRFRIFTDGKPRQLGASVRQEAYWIGREAMVNACRHSRGQNLEAEIGYARKGLRLIVRDDGIGIDPELLQSGRDRHWGLLGMRERAERIGAKLRVLSRVSGGTEIELSVPACVAFTELQ
jgi:signal transduction histidine kinase